jgi:hypothetical protein
MSHGFFHPMPPVVPVPTPFVNPIPVQPVAPNHRTDATSGLDEDYDFGGGFFHPMPSPVRPIILPPNDHKSNPAGHDQDDKKDDKKDDKSVNLGTLLLFAAIGFAAYKIISKK